MTFTEWCVFFETQTIEEMTPLVAMAFTTMFNAEHCNAVDPAVVKEIEQERAYKMVEYHCTRVGLEANVYAKAFLFALCENPAHITMYVCYIRSKTKELTMQVLSILFPWGFVSKEGLRNAWDAQKSEDVSFGGAQLDSFSYMKDSL